VIKCEDESCVRWYLTKKQSRNCKHVWTGPDQARPVHDTTAAKSAAQRGAREKEAKVGAGVWMWWTDGSHSEDGRVGAAAVCKHGNQWRSRRSFLDTGRMEVFDAELWPI